MAYRKTEACMQGCMLDPDHIGWCLLPEDNVEKLRVVQRPTAEDKVQREVLTHAESILALARDGQIDSLVVIMSHPDGSYSELISSTTQFRQMIGQLEVVKQNWIGNYLASLSGKPGSGK